MSVAALQAGGCPESLVAFAVGTRPVGKGAGAVRAPFAFAVGHVSRGKLTVLSTDSVWDAGQGEGTGHAEVWKCARTQDIPDRVQ